MQPKALLIAAAIAALAACGAPQPPPETNAPTADAAANGAAATPAPGLLSGTGPVVLTAQGPAEAASLTLTRTVHATADTTGQDPHIIVRLEQDAFRFMELHEANHTPFDVTAQAPGGVLAAAIGAPEGTAPVFYRVEQAAGDPMLCVPAGPTSVALYQDAAGALVMTGLTIATFEGEETETGIVLSPLPQGAVCDRAVFAPAP